MGEMEEKEQKAEKGKRDEEKYEREWENKVEYLPAVNWKAKTNNKRKMRQTKQMYGKEVQYILVY